MNPNSAAKISTANEAGSSPHMTTWVVCVVAAIGVAVLAQYLSPAVTEWLRWEHTASFSQGWRPVTGHFVHLSATHGAFNIAAILLVWRLFLKDWQQGDVLLMALSIPLTGLLLFLADLHWYVGFSGVLHGWFLLGAVRVWHAQKIFAAALVLGLLLKLWFEPNNPFAASEAEMIGGPIAYVAHQLGVLAMVILLICQFAAITLWDRVRR